MAYCPATRSTHICWLTPAFSRALLTAIVASLQNGAESEDKPESSGIRIFESPNWPVATTLAALQTGFFIFCLATCDEQRIAAAAPSLTAQISNCLSGELIIGEASTSSIVIAFLYLAYGL